MPQSDEEDVRAREGAQASPRTSSAGTQEGGSLTASRGLVSRLFGGLVSPRGGTASPESPRHDSTKVVLTTPVNKMILLRRVVYSYTTLM